MELNTLFLAKFKLENAAEKTSLRFIYVKYAHLLMKEGVRLLHWLTLIFITILSLHLTFMWPFRFRFPTKTIQGVPEKVKK